MTKLQPLVLTWPGVKHSFRFLQTGAGLKATLMIRKDDDDQTIDVEMPSGTTVDMIRKAWEGNWKQIYVKEKKDERDYYIAIRIIQLPGSTIVWYVCHRNGRCADECKAWVGNVTQAEIIATYVDLPFDV